MKGVVILPTFLFTEAKYKPTHVRVAGIVAMWAPDAPISRGLIARHSGLDKANVSRAVADLQAFGVLDENLRPAWGCNNANGVGIETTGGLAQKQPQGLAKEQPSTENASRTNDLATVAGGVGIETTGQKVSPPNGPLSLPPDPLTLSPLNPPASKIPPNGGVGAEVADRPCDAVKAMVESYNQTADRCGLPKVKSVTDERRRKARLRLGDCGGIAGWNDALAKLAAIRWMHGDNDHGWRADFDFLMQPKSLTRLIEGSYDRDGTSANGAGANGGVSERSRPKGPAPPPPDGWLEPDESVH